MTEDEPPFKESWKDLNLGQGLPVHIDAVVDVDSNEPVYIKKPKLKKPIPYHRKMISKLKDDTAMTRMTPGDKMATVGKAFKCTHAFNRSRTRDIITAIIFTQLIFTIFMTTLFMTDQGMITSILYAMAIATNFLTFLGNIYQNSWIVYIFGGMANALLAGYQWYLYALFSRTLIGHKLSVSMIGRKSLDYFLGTIGGHHDILTPSIISSYWIFRVLLFFELCLTLISIFGTSILFFLANDKVKDDLVSDKMVNLSSDIEKGNDINVVTDESSRKPHKSRTRAHGKNRQNIPSLTPSSDQVNSSVYSTAIHAFEDFPDIEIFGNPVNKLPIRDDNKTNPIESQRSAKSPRNIPTSMINISPTPFNNTGIRGKNTFSNIDSREVSPSKEGALLLNQIDIPNALPSIQPANDPEHFRISPSSLRPRMKAIDALTAANTSSGPDIAQLRAANFLQNPELEYSISALSGENQSLNQTYNLHQNHLEHDPVNIDLNQNRMKSGGH